MTTLENAPRRTADPAIERLADVELSLRSRMGYVALLLVALAMSGVVASLWATEPALPARTQLAFGVMTAIGLSWAVFAVWVLGRRRVLFARHRIVAGRMAVTFTTVYTIGAVALGLATGARASWAAAALGAAMLAGAVAALAYAHRVHSRLMERRRALERQLGRTG